MTEVTRVPLQPVAKGSLTKLWLGVIVAVLLGAGLAWAAAPAHVSVTTITAGTGDSPKVGDVVFVKYVGKLADGKEFDRSQPLAIPPGLLPEGNPLILEKGKIIDGFLDGMLKMQKGGKYTLKIPAKLAYGASPPPGAPIPPNADLVFDVEVVDFMSKADFEARAQVIQQMMQQQQAQQPQQGAAPSE
jgi:FKBP-type peptidyl-prolyl cis-trans isomerase FkpA